MYSDGAIFRTTETTAPFFSVTFARAELDRNPERFALTSCTPAATLLNSYSPFAFVRDAGKRRPRFVRDDASHFARLGGRNGLAGDKKKEKKSGGSLHGVVP